jgi:ketosteroid isomerase-like protein
MNLQDTITALEARLRLVEDKEKIKEVLARYGYNADLGRSEEYVDVWTDDGLYDLGAVKYAGKAQIREMITSPTGMHKTQIENRSLHTVCNLHIGVEGDTAWAEGYSIVFVKGEGGVKPLTAGYNHWDFVRAGDGWLMTRRLRRDVGGEEWGGETINSYLEQPAASAS